MRILYVMFFILALIGIVPWVDGQIVKHNYTNLLNAINADSQFNLKVLEYRTGWITSRVKISVAPDSDSSSVRMPGQNASVTVEQKIIHGPIIFDQDKITFALASIKTSFHAPEVIEAFLLGGKKETGLMQVETLSNFNGSYDSQIQIPIISFQSPFGGLTWQGFNGNTYMEVTQQRLSRFKAQFIIGSISVDSRQGSFIAEPETYTYDMTRQANSLWNGTISLSAPSMSFNYLSQSHNLTKLDFSTSFGVDGNNFYNILIDSSLDQLKTPNYFINPAKFKLAINNLNVNGCIEFMSLISALKSQQISTDDLESQYEIILPHLITPSTNINTDLLVSTSAGRMISNAKLFWPKNMSSSATLEEVANKMNVQANFRISISLVNRIMQVLADKNKSKLVPSIFTGGQANAADKKEFDDQIDAWVQQGQVSSYAADKLKEMRDKHISMDVYATNVDQFVKVNEILPNAASPLKEQYAALGKKDSTFFSQRSVADESVSPLQKMQNQLDDMLKKGYLVRDKDDYVISVTREQGVMKANGIVIPAPAQKLVQREPLKAH